MANNAVQQQLMSWMMSQIVDLLQQISTIQQQLEQ